MFFATLKNDVAHSVRNDAIFAVIMAKPYIISEATSFGEANIILPKANIIQNPWFAIRRTKDFVGPPCRIRTCDPQNRNLILYPAELRAEIFTK